MVRRMSVIVVSVLVVVTGWVVVSSRATAASSTPVVYVATGENFPDALGASAAAAVQGGPVLLVRKGSIPSETAAELSRLSPDVIFVVGGTAVITDSVVSQLGAYASTVTRVAGANRYATAAAVSAAVFPVTSSGGGGAALEAAVAALTARVDTLESKVAGLESDNDDLEALLAGVTRNGDTLKFTGMNLQVVNGLGSTATSNGLGNVIIGYNEDVGTSETRTGSHYLIVGREHTWTAYAGIVAGYSSTVTGAYASVSGGYYNTASGTYTSVSGGLYNTASGNYSSVSGGWSNTASGWYASVSGGRDNRASGNYSSVSGGRDNRASGDYTSILGGQNQTVNTTYGIYPT
jgi:hypothetical protein